MPFGESQPGTSALELLLPLTLKWASETNTPLVKALSRISTSAARVLEIEGGSLAPGKPADICVFDPETRQTVSAATLRSQGKNTPFLGIELPGVVRATLVSGRVVYEPT